MLRTRRNASIAHAPTRHRVRAAMLAWVGVVATCGGLDQIRIEESGTAVVEQGTVVESLLLDLGFSSLIALDVASNESLKNQGVQRHQIDSVRLEDLSLTIVAPAPGQDFTFISGIEFFVRAQGLPQQRIAHGGPFEAGESHVVLDIDDVELAEYVAAPALDIVTAVNGVRPQQRTEILAEIGLVVDVDVGGLLCGPTEP